MNTAKRTKCYRKGNEWFVDNVPVGSKSRLIYVDFSGIGQKYEHQYKNGNTQTRWKLVDSLSPKDEVWFILKVGITDCMSDFHLAVKLGKNKITHEWLTEKELKASQSLSCPTNLSVIEVALIETEIDGAIAGD